MHLRMCTKFLAKVILSNLDTIIISLNVRWFVPCRCPSLEFDSNCVVSRHSWLEWTTLDSAGWTIGPSRAFMSWWQAQRCLHLAIYLNQIYRLTLFHTVSWTWTYQRRKRSTVPSRGPVIRISEPQALHDSECLTDCTKRPSWIFLWSADWMLRNELTPNQDL